MKQSELDFLIQQIDEYRNTISPIKGINYDVLNRFIENARESYKLQEEVNKDFNLKNDTQNQSGGLVIRRKTNNNELQNDESF